MTSYTWILLLLASLVATRAQDFDLADAFDDESPAKPTEKPVPPKIPDSETKKPAVVPPKTDDGDLNLLDAFGPDSVTKKPVVPPKERGTGGGSFDDKDLFDLNEDGEYKPDGGRSGGRGANIPQDNGAGGASDQPQDLNQHWLQIIKMLVDNIPDGLSSWIAQFNQAVKPMLEQLREFLNITEEKTEL
ncbi:CD99 molecule isoform X2 [Carassius gibelio]|uniref:CD99 molecule isoform X2 n=1 Tax=Carassius gibelio TaxID=101364 RepID=UPI002278F6C0|nr:CD99 molecule isoform X2 [Carassius gibelio]